MTMTATNLTHEDVEEDGDYTMDELYDQYNSQDDGWETASDASDDGSWQKENVSPPKSQPFASSARKVIDTDSDDEEDAATPPNVVISRSPPLDITKHHPITHELSKREQYRRQVESASNEISCAWVEQFEDVLSNEMRCLTLRNNPGRMRLGTVTHHQVFLCA